MHADDPLLADGGWREPSSSRTVPVISPTSGERFASDGTVGRSLGCGRRGVAAARRALCSPEWAGIGPEERAILLEGLAEELGKIRAERAALTTVQNRMPIGLVQASEGGGPVRLVRLLRRTCPDQPCEVASALASGCAVVLRPSPETTLTALGSATAAKPAGLPTGVLNIGTVGVEIGR
ncbi:aldehyde dehydrogenase family protein [Streptomyces sp. Y7]|uniref:aldehyde dehydrogenase family protein n=1 Tax=Streptomyces sp. Y7 TaxID=3342392 RepID=UPI00371E7D48